MKNIVICYHTYELLAILKIVSSVLKIKNYSIQLFIMHVSSYFSFFELITIICNEMSIISLTLLIKHVFNFVIWCIDLHAKICILIKLIIKLSFHIYILTQLKYLSWIFWLNLNTQVESHDSTWYWFRVESEFADSTQLIKQSNMTSRELNIEIFSIFRLCIIFLHYLFDRKS